MSPDLFCLLMKLEWLGYYEKILERKSFKTIIYYRNISKKNLILNQIYMYKWYQEKCRELGRTFARYNGVAPTIVTIDPEFIKEVTVKQFDNFADTFDWEVPDDHMTLDLAP